LTADTEGRHWLTGRVGASRRMSYTWDAITWYAWAATEVPAQWVAGPSS